MNSPVVIGVDYGTLSARALVVRVSDGAELGSAVHPYRHGVMDRALTAHRGEPLPPEWALQNPGDYLEALAQTVPAALAEAGVDARDVIGLAIGFTSCTMLPVTADGTPLCELPGFAGRRHAYVKLWKHHAAQPQAERITNLAAGRDEGWLARYGGLISSEWAWAKGLQLLEEDPEAYHAMDYFVEAMDWLTWRLTGNLVRSACAAGYKGLLQDGRYPSADFAAALHPEFSGFAADKLAGPIGQLGDQAGTLTPEAATLTGLPVGIAVAVGNVDAHVAVPAAGGCEPGRLVIIMGTSSCHIVSSRELRTVPGMCGVVDGGVVSGYYGYEAGQSGVGDIFAWFVDNCVPARYTDEAAQRGISVHDLLTAKCATQPTGGHGLLALDWWSGNRSVLVDHDLSGLILGMTLTTQPEDIYRALLEATAFGTRTIIETFRSAGVEIGEIIVTGGLLKNSFLMQTYADVCRLPLSTAASAQGAALGAAIHAAVAAGAYPDVPTAARAMGAQASGSYVPDPGNADRYDALFAEYTRLHDDFGRGVNPVMRTLKRIRRETAG
ncbi:MAG: ribulokinase [Propionibacteriaceae bacterium]|nr:ribulokinase [Propionibacteriaceae bacterium]